MTFYYDCFLKVSATYLTTVQVTYKQIDMSYWHWTDTYLATLMLKPDQRNIRKTLILLGFFPNIHISYVTFCFEPVFLFLFIKFITGLGVLRKGCMLFDAFNLLASFLAGHSMLRKDAILNWYVKFMFSKKVTKIDKIFTVNLTSTT